MYVYDNYLDVNIVEQNVVEIKERAHQVDTANLSNTYWR